MGGKRSSTLNSLVERVSVVYVEGVVVVVAVGMVVGVVAPLRAIAVRLVADKLEELDDRVVVVGT